MQQMQITKPPFAKPVYVALYLRLSRDDEQQGESGSIQTQRQLLTKYCQDNGFYIVGEYVDDGYSGTNFDRPGFQRMIDDIEDGKINCVITKDLSRLGRNYILTGHHGAYCFCHTEHLLSFSFSNSVRLHDYDGNECKIKMQTVNPNNAAKRQTS